MQALIIYDVNARNPEVKRGLQNLGYFSSWFSKEIKYNLPNNAVWKPGIELSVALNDLQNVIRGLNNEGSIINLQRCIVVSAHPWDGIIGSPA